MAQTAQEREIGFLANIQETTGKTLDEWMSTIEDTGIAKHPEIIKWIKTEHGFNHMIANMITSIYKNDGKPVYDYDAMYAKLFDGLEHQRPLYEEIITLVKDEFPDVVIAPTKTYVEFSAERCFGMVKIMRSTLRVGLDLGDLPYNDTVEKAKSLGAMPRFGHMIEVKASADVNDAMRSYLRQSYDRVHKS